MGSCRHSGKCEFVPLSLDPFPFSGGTHVSAGDNSISGFLRSCFLALSVFYNRVLVILYGLLYSFSSRYLVPLVFIFGF